MYFSVHEDFVTLAIERGIGQHSPLEGRVLELAAVVYRQMDGSNRERIRRALRDHVAEIAAPDYEIVLHGPCRSAQLYAQFERFEAARGDG